MMARKSAFEEFLVGHHPDTAALARRLRALVRRHLTGAVETGDRDFWGIGWGTGYRDTLFVISPQKGYVNLGVSDGAILPDPGGLLEGAGKRHRHIKLRTVSQVSDPRLARLIQAAVKRHPRSAPPELGRSRRSEGKL
jgi:hypothetical protein